MTEQEKGTWMFGAIPVVGYGVYLALVLPQLGRPVAEVAYQWPMAGTILAAIAVGIVGGIVVGMLSPKDAGKADQRDREIDRFGSQVGQSFVVLSAVLTVISKLVAYRRGFHPW